ncbi:MAG: oxygen-independent coproporphyrinogen III oxidase [Candidatus Kariarchaeaceae archaeon]|jgi:oxygen-independent coproporphyrinogen-3 oxidase
MDQNTDITVDQIEKYDLRVPRYTSYPPVPNWQKQYSAEDHVSELQKIGQIDEPLSLYIHIPFCIRRCLFCACNVLVTKRKDRPERYLEYLLKEIKSTVEYLAPRNQTIQLHLGGGTPTHFTPEQLNRLFSLVFEKFNFQIDSEKSIEVHPSVTSTDHLDVLRDFGFNRLSLGVQDFDPNVQEKLNRFQTFQETSELIQYARDSGFQGINIDLIYGLPYQSPKTMSNTLEQVFDIRPDRIALYSYAHFPTIFRHHKSIPLDVISTGTHKLQLFLSARKTFLENEYQQIGFDHFALKDDELWSSFKNRSLRRNFMGYTTKAGTDLLAFGWSGISELRGSYAQNSKEMDEYEELIDKYGTATIKGHKLSDDDVLRKEVIMDILCLGILDYNALKSKFAESAEAIIQIAEKVFPEFEQINFVERYNGGWKNTPKGNIFARIIASSFDVNYEQSKHLFSRSV